MKIQPLKTDSQTLEALITASNVVPEATRYGLKYSIPLKSGSIVIYDNNKEFNAYIVEWKRNTLYRV